MAFARGEAARQLEADILPAYLVDCRWYGAKDAGAPAVRIEDTVALGADDEPVLLILAVTPPGQAAQRYLLPIMVLWDGAEVPASAALAEVQAGTSRGILVDAFVDDRFVRLLLAGIRAGDEPGHVRRSGFVFRRTAALAALEDGLTGAVERSTAEQSNTSLRIGGTMFKAFRKLEPGTHPELEMSGFLTERAGFGNVPALLGSVEHVDASGNATALCVLQALVPNQGDGWTYALARLKRTFDEQVGADLLQLARRLGQRTAELHHALAMPSAEKAFSPEPVEEPHLSAWTDAVQRQARTALAALEKARPHLDPALRAEADRLIGSRQDLMERIGRLTPVRVEARRTRLHGDYHLGQVLVSDGDVFIIDFEGEPMRPLAERRAKHSPLKDVAGMLRSFAYAGAAAERDLPREQLPAAAERLSALTRDMSTAFLEEYERTIRGCPSHPADPAHAASLLRLFLLEKALYEVAYELANRPDWVGIPLAGVRALLHRNASTEVASAGEAGSFTSPTRKEGPSMAEPVRRAHKMPFSAEMRSDGSVRFRLWAPAQERISLVVEGQADPAPMTALEDGWHELAVEEARAGTRYRFALEDGSLVPDPASRHQPDDVHGPSEVIDPTAYAWRDGSWQGRPWHEAVVYELHVGTFTPEGTFRAAIGKLDHLVELGVTAIELMPIADFPGGRNWGYDGVCLFAPDASYGRPDDLKALVDAAHAKGLMVLLDVVYNHFGPDGNYLNAYACQFFTERHKTPWGAAINYDGSDSRPVRDFMTHNALYWLEEYHFDGLRLDAVHAIIDDSETHLLEELAERVRGRFGGERHVHLILENEENEARRLERGPGGEPLTYTAQWNDDVHHVLHTAATGEDAGYYGDYAGDTEKLARALAEGFAFQGEMMAYRGEPRGEPSRNLPPTAFVAFIQNHDQIGNRAFGDRLTASTPAEAVRAIAAVYLLAPQVPMLFMGEEWAAAQPFPFFCDFEAELGEAVRKGRREEFARFPEFQDEAARERIPDPLAEKTFASAKLAWDDLSREPHAGWLDWYRRVLASRRTEIVPRLGRAPGNAGEYETFGKGAFRVGWRLGDGSRLSLVANLSDADLDGVGPSAGRVVWSEGEVDRERGSIGPWSLVWSIESGGDAQGAGHERL